MASSQANAANSASSDLTSLVNSSPTSASKIYPTDDSITSFLQSRFRSDLPYTRLSDSTLIVINPLRTLSNLNDQSSENYRKITYQNVNWEKEGGQNPANSLEPHPYELASKVYLAMRRTAKSQAVVFSGATDSGKSFTSKLFTSQLLRLSSSSTKSEAKLSEQVKSLETLLNSFGTCKTKFNSNASRVSRYQELHFDKEGRLKASKILTFGLEKKRINKLLPDERTFHVFYQLLAGATSEERDTFRLDDVTSYALLNSSGCYRLPGGPSSDDSIAMDELRAAMKILGFKSKQTSAIFTLLSAILLLGNIQFSDHNGTDASFESAHITNKTDLEDVSELLGLNSEELEQALTTKSRFVRKELITSLLNAESSSLQRDNLMSDLYSTLFAFVIETANHKLAPSSDEIYPTQIVQLDNPGYQSRSGSSIAGAPPSLNQPNRYQEFITNFIAETIQNWNVRRAFDDDLQPNKEMLHDGLPLPEVITGDNTACLELLRGTYLGTACDRKPTGLLGSMDKISHKVKSGKINEDDDAALLTELDTFAIHGSYVPSNNAQTSAQQAQQQPGSSKAFGINHYQGSCSYNIENFLESDLDLFDSSFVQLLRKSHESFVSKLFAGPSLSTETHPLDPNTVVSAQVSSRPLRRPTPLISSDSEIEPLLDPTKVYGVSRQLNSTISELLNLLNQAGKIWNVICLRPNDISQPNSFDSRRVKSQIRSLLLPDLIKKKSSKDFFIGFTVEEFCIRFSSSIIPASLAAGVNSSEPKDKIQAFVIANAWRDGKDFQLGKEKVWLNYESWRRLEDRLRSNEVQDPTPGSGMITSNRDLVDDEGVSPIRSPSYPPIERANSYLNPLGGGDNMETKDLSSPTDEHLLLRRPSDPFATPGERSTGGGGTNDGGDSIVGWGSEWDKRAYGDANPGMAGALEKDGNLDGKAIDALEEEPTTKIRRAWVALSWLFTFWIPPFLLSSLGGMKRPDVQQAWREKVTICALIFILCGTILFYILVFGKLLCPNMDKAWNESQLSGHDIGTDYYSAIAGKVYDFTKFWKRDHADVGTVDDDTMLQLAGKDLTPYFPVPLNVGCRTLQNNPNFILNLNSNLTATITQAVHTSGVQQSIQDTKLDDQNWYFDRLEPFLKDYYKGFYVYSKKRIQDDSSWRNWAIVDDKVYDLTNYLGTLSTSATQTADSGFLDESISSLFKSQAGEDISKDFKEAMGGLNATYGAAHQNCLDNNFYVGKIDFRDSAKCKVQNYLLLAFSVLLVATLLAKFLAALQLAPKRNPEQQDKFVICQVPCYTEGEDELRKTIDSLAGLKYDDKRKLLFIICDGMIVGSGNERPTPRIVLDILGVDPKIDPEPLMFKSVAEGSKQLNYGKIYSGLYEFEGHVVPYIVVVKCGRPSERSRPGNRGKRDTQVLLMRYLNRVHFDSPMAPLELEIYHQMKNVIGIDPAFYEYILMVDADTSVEPDSLNRLVAVCADDSRIIAVCGETKLDNEEGSWWTMIQVYEYFISHHLSKAFESLFGSVTCLPGCFSMYRIRSSDKGRPLFISNRVIDDYSENRVDTLHKKNLLSLGEDRYLTTLILKNFPAFRTKFTPDAHAHTAAPDRWGILLSQRRRWINSTIHNLAELVLMPELCGFCLFSMRFIVFIDLLGTLILPATVVYLIYLIVVVSTGDAALPLISLIMIGATYGLQVIIFLLKRQWQYIGWMLIYILAYPIYSFFLPIYSFWHMDDFSWGNTRIVVGEKGNKKVVAGTDDEPYDDSMIPLKKFTDYQRDVWEQPTNDGNASMRSGVTGVSAGPFGNQYGVPMGGGPGSTYKGSPYAASNNGSDYGGDYFQNTNVLTKNGNHSRSASGAFSTVGGGSKGPSRMPSQAFGAPSPGMMGTPDSIYGMPQAPMSMYGMPNMYSAPPQSMYGLPPQPQTTTNSMYGMPMAGISGTMSDFGAINRSSTIPLGQQITGGSMNWGMGGNGMDSQSRRQSSGTQLNNNPFGSTNTINVLEKNEESNPTDEDLATAVRTYLTAQTNLMNVTKRQVREAVVASFPNASLADRKATINKAVDDTLSSA